MLTARSRFETPNGSSYLQRLCKHFEHKIKVEYDAHRGHCTLPSGQALMEADETGISFLVEADDAEGLARGKGVIESHLVRFAFRENLERLDWQEGAPAA
ncbi:DUF2218 domain-containing protein [Plastorhodobacter daqingensis]|uniref:DUF2218 domain-containing protein n=1 Tax=Plastorhodobacter daqingensis TaxID=1387281 RepID=A0ABW2UQS8_9RHOB